MDNSVKFSWPNVKTDLVNDDMRTTIVNADEIASAIKVPSFFLMDYLADELFISVSSYCTNTLEGVCSEKRLQRKIDRFIRQFIICDDCSSHSEIEFISENTILKTCTNCTKSCTLHQKNTWKKV